MFKRLLKVISVVSLLALLATPSFAQYNGVRVLNFTTQTSSSHLISPGLATANTSTNFNAGLFQLSWTGTGTRTTCTVEMRAASTYGGSYTLFGSAQTCTTDGSYTIWVQPASTNAYVDIDVTAITGTGNTIRATLTAFNNTPSQTSTSAISTGSNCGTSASCAAPAAITMKVVQFTQVAFSSSTTLALTGMPAFSGTTTYSCYVTDTAHPAYTFGTAAVSSSATTLTASTSNSDSVNVTCIGY